MSYKLKGGDEMEMLNVNSADDICMEDLSEKKSVYQGRYFGVVLYPNEDDRHANMLRYLENHMFQFEHLYIEHEAEEEEKKIHTHVLIKTRNKQRVTAFVKFFNIWINYAEAITDPVKYIMYLLHDTPESSHKKSYKVEEFRGSKELLRMAYDIRNLHFIQLGEFAKCINEGSTLSSIIQEICSESDDYAQKIKIDTVNKYQYLMVAIGQEKRSLQTLKYREKEIDINEKTLQLHMTGEI